MDLEIKLIKKDGHSIRQDVLALVHGKDFFFEWIGMYQSHVLVKAKLKKGWSMITSADIFIDYDFLKQAGITLGDDKREIAFRINETLFK